jgi:hypothetical protein
MEPAARLASPVLFWEGRNGAGTFSRQGEKADLWRIFLHLGKLWRSDAAPVQDRGYRWCVAGIF